MKIRIDISDFNKSDFDTQMEEYNLKGTIISDRKFGRRWYTVEITGTYNNVTLWLEIEMGESNLELNLENYLIEE